MDENLTLTNGAAFMDKCLETVLNEQRSAAHSAIDMDDWEKAQEILAVVKRNISLIEDLKVKFAEFKNEALAAEATILGDADKVTVSGAQNTAAKENVPEAPIAGEELVKLLEEIIVEYPGPMMVCNEAADIGALLTYDEAVIKTMKKPASLSNGLSVDTAMSKDDGMKLVEKVREYCKANN